MTNHSEITTSYTLDDPNLHYSVTWRSNGTIVCGPCEDVWCSHLEKWCKKREDCDFIIRNNGIETDLMIPMVPSYDLWEKVKLMRSDNDENLMVVLWKRSPENIDWKFLTHLRRGEGRMAIRESLFQQMMGDPLRPNECVAAHHSYVAQMEYEKRLSSNESFAEYWSIWRTLHCIYCNTHDASGDPDLIPPKESNVW